MENTLNTYKQNRGSIYTTSDGQKYLVTERKDTFLVIQLTYNEIDHQSLNLEEATLVIKLKIYIQRRWINQIPATELSIFHQKMATNNGSESKIINKMLQT